MWGPHGIHYVQCSEDHLKRLLRFPHDEMLQCARFTCVLGTATAVGVLQSASEAHLVAVNSRAEDYHHVLQVLACRCKACWELSWRSTPRDAARFRISSAWRYN